MCVVRVATQSRVCIKEELFQHQVRMQVAGHLSEESQPSAGSVRVGQNQMWEVNLGCFHG